jgi:chemotaxis protein MotB
MAAMAGLATGCVRKTDYDKVVADATAAKADAEVKQKSDAAEIARLNEALSAAEAETQDRDSKLSEVSTARHNLQAELDEATAMNEQLRGELQRLGKDVDKILQDRGTLAKALDDAKLRLEELRKAQAAAEARTQLFRDFDHRFKALVDAGQLRVESRRGRLVIDVSGDLLFEAGHAEVRTAGQGALMEIAKALQSSGTPPPPAPPARRFLVTAHVDDAPLKSKKYKSVWDLTAARGVAVVEYLVSMGVAVESLTAAGAGSYDPLVPNDSADARGKNRRVEIALMPAADETLPATPPPSR